MRRALLTWLALALAACTPQEAARDYGDPTALSTPTDEGGITAWVASPALTDELGSATPEIVLGAYALDEEAGGKPKPLLVQLGRVEKDDTGYDQVEDLRPAEVEGEPGPEQRFRFTMPLLHGQNRILVRIETSDRTRVRRLTFALDYRGEAPGIALSVRAPRDLAAPEAEQCDETVPIAQAVTRARRVCVSGQVSTLEQARATLSLGLSGFERSTVKLDAQGRFAVGLSLPANRRHVLEARVTDAAQQATSAQLSLVQDEMPPSLSITSAARETSAETLELEGTASDPYGLDALEVQNASGAVQEVGRASPFSAVVRLGLGTNAVEVVARDVAGNEARVPLTLSRRRTLWLDAPTRDAGATALELDRLDLTELLTVDDQKELAMADIGLGPSVHQALERIREPELYGVDTSEWGDAERNMQRILTMTPDTADLSGTSMEELLTIANAIGLPAPRVLAEILDLDVTEPIIDPDTAADVIMDLLVGAHPNVKTDAKGNYVIDVSMYDVFQDMQTIAPRFGPSGEHPGFLEGQSHSEVLQPGFLLTMPVRSNLVQYDAIDLSRRTKDFLFILAGERVLDFDVETSEFVVVGLADEPTVDLRFKLLEHPGPGLLVAGSGREAGADAADPGFFRGNGQGFAADSWLFEHIAVEAGYRTFHRAFESAGFHRVLRYDAGTIEDAAVIDWNRGWVTIETAGGIGDPPPPLYAWDLLMEVAQVRLHDSGLGEGEANMAFSLDDLKIGVTADELIEKLRPKLAEQETELSELFVGDLGLAASGADLFYAPAAGKDGALLFRAAGDSASPYTYPKPGFFSDETLTEKVSTLAPAGGVTDPAHEKVVAKVGAVYYAADEAGDVYAIELTEREGTRLGVQLRRMEAIE
jgi:hypothetical protein